MNRRDFLFRMAAAAAIAVVDPAELLERLAPRRLFTSIDLAPKWADVALETNGPITYYKISELREAYRQATAPLYRVYRRAAPEYLWNVELIP